MKAYVFHAGKVEIHPDEFPPANDYPVGTWAYETGYSTQVWVQAHPETAIASTSFHEWRIEHSSDVPPKHLVELLLIKE